MFFFENLILIFFAASIFLLVVIYFNAYLQENVLLIAFIIYTLSIYSLSVFPGSSLVNSFSIFLFSIILGIYFVYRFSFEETFTKKICLKKPENNVILIALLFFLISLLINHKDYTNFFGFSKIYIFITFVIFFSAVLPYRLSNVLTYNKFLMLITWVGIITSLIAIVNVVIGFNTFRQFESNITISYFRHPNNAAFIYTFSFITCTYCFLFRQNRAFKKFFYLGASILIIYGMLFTYSRAGYFAILVGLAILIYFYKKRLLLYIAGVSIILSAYIIQNFLFAKGTISLFSRFALIYSGIEMLKSSNKILLFGVGSISVFTDYSLFKLQILDNLVYDPVEYPHNFILFYALQFGILSLIPILIYLIIILYKCTRLIYSNRKEYKYLILPFTIVISILFQSLLEDTILFPEFFVYPLFLTFLGIIIFNVNKHSQFN